MYHMVLFRIAYLSCVYVCQDVRFFENLWLPSLSQSNVVGSTKKLISLGYRIIFEKLAGAPGLAESEIHRIHETHCFLPEGISASCSRLLALTPLLTLANFSKYYGSLVGSGARCIIAYYLNRNLVPV